MNLETQYFHGRANGLRYLRWGRDGEAVQPEKGYSVENCLGCAQNPQRQVHALLGGVLPIVTLNNKRNNIKSLVILEK